MWWPGTRSACNFTAIKNFPLAVSAINLDNPRTPWICIVTLPYNLSLIARFRTLMFCTVVWQHMQGMVASAITTLLQIYGGMFQWKNFESRLRFDWIMAMSLVCSFLAHPVNNHVGLLVPQRNARRIQLDRINTDIINICINDINNVSINYWRSLILFMILILLLKWTWKTDEWINRWKRRKVLIREILRTHLNSLWDQSWSLQALQSANAGNIRDRLYTVWTP